MKRRYSRKTIKKANPRKNIPGNFFIGKVKRGSKPQVAAVIWGSKLMELASRAKKDGADILEIRVDLFQNFKIAQLKKDLWEIKRRTKLPLLLTIRRKDEGGKYSYLEEKRLYFFRALIPLVEMIDIELRSQKIIKRVIQAAKSKRKKVIISYHNFKKTPSGADLAKLTSRAEDQGADIVKLAVMARSKKDVRRLGDFARFCPFPLVTISMGKLGKFSRVRTQLGYAYVEEKTAPGQFSVRELKKKLILRVSKIS